MALTLLIVIDGETGENYVHIPSSLICHPSREGPDFPLLKCGLPLVTCFFE